MYARFPIGPEADNQDVEWGYHSSAEIKKPSGAAVARTAFLDDLFPHVNAIAYSPANLLGLANPHWQVGVLHNPSSSWPERAPHLGMGNEYYVALEDETFALTRRTLAELPED